MAERDDLPRSFAKLTLELAARIERRELRRFKDIAKSTGLSAGDMIAVFMRRTISAGKFTFEIPRSNPIDPMTSAADHKVSGVKVTRLSELGSAAANKARLRHLQKESYPMAKNTTFDHSLDSENHRTFMPEIQSKFMQRLATDELVPEASFLARIGWPKPVLTSVLTDDRIFFVELEGVRAYPAFYLDARYDMKTLQSVTRLMGSLSGESKWTFFTTPKASLALTAKHGQEDGTARTPLEAIEAGDIDAVQRTALGFVER